MNRNEQDAVTSWRNVPSRPVDQTSVSLGACDPKRYGKQGVLRCAHGCVTQCEKERRAR